MRDQFSPTRQTGDSQNVKLNPTYNRDEEKKVDMQIGYRCSVSLLVDVFLRLFEINDRVKAPALAPSINLNPLSLSVANRVKLFIYML